MKAESNIKPAAADIEVYENGLAAMIMRENITEAEKDGETVYQYDEYRMVVPYRENLLEYLNKSFDSWLESAKKIEYEELAADVRTKRDALLRESDALMCLDRAGLSKPESDDDWTAFMAGIAAMLFGEWAKYRQALRDVPQQEGFPYNVEFPEKPESNK